MTLPSVRPRRGPSGSDSAELALEATEVTVHFGGLTALDGVSVAVPRGSVVGLVGPNGAGKSTLFSVISGIRRPDRGRVLLDGTDVTGVSVQKRAASGLSRSFQHTELFDDLTVREHVALADRIRHSRARLWTDAFTFAGFRRTSPDEDRRVDSILARLGLTPIEDRRVESLPLPTSRLVELARAVAQEPKVLLLDEPGSGLDHQERRQLAKTLLSLARVDGVAILLVEHDVELVLSISDYVYVLDFGKCISEGAPDEIRADPEVRRAYLGDFGGARHD